MDTWWFDCPRDGKVRVLDRDILEELVPGAEKLPELERGVGFRCPVCGVGWWKDLYDTRNHWRHHPIGLRPFPGD